MTRIIVLLAMLSAFPPMSTDMYLPSLPLLEGLWGQSRAAMNTTLVFWFATYCLFLLIYGPISDRLGRKPPLYLGLAVFVAGSLGCAFAQGLPSLLAARVVQAAGAAASTVMAMAITKDLFEVTERARILGYIGVINGLAPMLAPTLGGWIMMAVGWRWVFVVQALWAALLLPSILRLPEPLAHPVQIPLARVFGNYWRLTKNWRFSCLNLAMALPTLAMFSFIAASPSIYIRRFGLSEAQFGYFFGFNALAMMAGAYCFNRLGRKLGHFQVMVSSFMGMMTGGALLILLPHATPWQVALPMWLVSFSIGLNRPPSFSLILEQVEGDAGSASSLISFTVMMSGAVAMYLVSLGWTDQALVIGTFALGGGILALSGLLAMRRHLAGLGNRDVGAVVAAAEEEAEIEAGAV